MAKLLMIVSSARTIRLADGSDHPTGYRAEEVRKPYETFVAAGVDVVIATPDGRVPRPDPWGLEPFFHYPQVDEDFMFSVLRRFAYHPDRVRVTFTHFSELNLVAIRRVYRGLLDAGMEPAEARKAVESAAPMPVGTRLRLVHGAGKPVAALCHGPAALLSAPQADGAWMFDGYRMTAFTDEEEDQTKAGKIGMPWYVEAALKNRGAIFDDGDAAWVSHVVVDRNLITGQNPGSAEAAAGALLKRLRA